jgi:hypothetical protein
MHGGLAYRIYAITWKNKLLGSVLALVIVAELVTRLISAVWIGLDPCESHNHLSF